MKKFTTFPESKKLEIFRVALTNAVSNAEIANLLSRFGFTAESLEKGKALLEATKKAYDKALTLKKKRTGIYYQFKKKLEAFDKIYVKHRKLTRIAFEDDKLILDSLRLSDSHKRVYVKWIEMVKTFYSKTTVDTSIKEVLVKYNIASEELDAGLALIPEIEQIRAEYVNEKGASQDATSAKNKAFEALEDWMEEFFDLSRVALRKQPQLMEALGIVTKK
jgi:hypothetical protein